jgi:hypothetical protein
MKQQFNELIERVSPKAHDLLELLDLVMNEIADARNGDYSTESRKQAIEAIQNSLYNKIKATIKSDDKKKDDDSWL